jgi:hypothetical protein
MIKLYRKKGSLNIHSEVSQLSRVTKYGMFSEFSMFFFLCFFHHVSLLLFDSYTPDHKIHITFKTVLCMNLCLEEHMWEITESGEFRDVHCYLQYSCRHWCGDGLGTYLHYLVLH